MYRARAIVSGITGGHGPFAGWLLAKNATPAISCATVRNYNVPVASESFLNGSSSQYVEDMYNAWLADPSSVHTVSVLQFRLRDDELIKLSRG
jgi:2-oxoglutarate dehydrogenase E1 component